MRAWRSGALHNIREAGIGVDIRRAGAWALVLLCASMPAAAGAQAYSVEVQPSLGDLAIRIETVPTDGLLVVRLTNDGNVKARCDLRYDASPQPIHRAYVYVEPGESVENSFRARRRWFTVVVDVSCKATGQS
jgi:hypothetical protein